VHQGCPLYSQKRTLICAREGTAADMIQATIFLASADMAYVMATRLRV